MPIVPVILVFAILLGLLVAALGPALKYAERRAGQGADELDRLRPRDWEPDWDPVVAGGVMTRRFAPRTHPAAGDTAGARRASERQAV
jgi:hypothetical protein